MKRRGPETRIDDEEGVAMPLVGLKDRTGTGWTWDEIKVGNGDFEDPPVILLSFFRDRTPYCDFSVTELINDPYSLQMTRRLPYFESTDDIMDRLIGISLHRLIEQCGKDHADSSAQQETEYKLNIISGEKTYVVGGRSDLTMVVAGTMWDWKSYSTFKVRMAVKGEIADIFDDVTKQLNMYRYLRYVCGHGKLVENLRVRIICKDWRFYEFRQAGYDIQKYPRGAIVPIEVWPMSRTKTFITNRVKVHAEALEISRRTESMSDLPEALKAGGVARCDTWHSEKYGHLRCEWYCPVKDRCPFWLAACNEAKHEPTPTAETAGKTTKKGRK